MDAISTALAGILRRQQQLDERLARVEAMLGVTASPASAPVYPPPPSVSAPAPQVTPEPVAVAAPAANLWPSGNQHRTHADQSYRASSRWSSGSASSLSGPSTTNGSVLLSGWA